MEKSLEEFESVDRWLTELHSGTTGSAGTVATYLRRLEKFCKWAKMNPDELVAKAKAESKWAEKLVKRYFRHLTESGLARTTARSIYGSLRSFFVYNDIPFFSKMPIATVATRTVIPDKNELVKVFEAADLQQKVIMVILNDTGMRQSDAANLKVGDLEKVGERYYIEKVSVKEDLWFAVCLTKAGTRILDMYFDFRMRMGEKVAENSPVITSRINHGEFISANMIYREVADAGEKVGVKLSPKIFRKRFRTEASPLIGRDAVCKMGAWAIPGAGRHYYLPPKAKTVELYTIIEPTLALERVTSTADLKAQREIAAQMLKAAGFDPELLLKKAKVKGLKAEAQYLTSYVGKMLRKKVEPEAGGLSAQQQLANVIAEAFKMALKQLQQPQQ